MIRLTKHFLLNDEPGAAGGGDPVVDRGDELEPKAAPVAAVVDTSDDASKDVKDALKLEKAPPDDDKGDEDKSDDDKGDDKEDKEGKRKDTRVPLDRHTAILNKERAQRAELETKLAQYERGGQIAAVNADITALEESVAKLEKDYATALTDGEIDKATSIMAEIRKADRQITNATSDMRVTAEIARATETARYNVALERVESAYPTLNPDHDDFDSAELVEVAELKSAFELQGKTPTVALQKAVDILLGKETVKQKEAIDVKPRVAEKDVAAERKAAAVTKAVEAVNKTPPNAGRVGLDSDKMGGDLKAEDVLKMSQEDFSKLSDSALAKLRGDEV